MYHNTDNDLSIKIIFYSILCAIMSSPFILYNGIASRFQETNEFTVYNVVQNIERDGTNNIIGVEINGVKEVVEITDSYFTWSHDTFDRLSVLQKGAVCTGTFVGWRAPLFGIRRNIIDVTCEQPK